MIVIDGSQGEGGGQILRTALTLSLVTGQPFRIFNIRAHRRKSGLRRQHLTAVRTARAVSRAQVIGAQLGASEVEFWPTEVRPGTFEFDVGTAGSTTLIAQTVIPALISVDGDSHIQLFGGTHNPNSPSFEFLDRSYLPILNTMGARAAATLLRPGYFPAGEGSMTVDIESGDGISELDFADG